MPREVGVRPLQLLTYGVLVCGITPLGLMFARPSAHWVELYRFFESSKYYNCVRADSSCS